jgi:hypothetical protein
MKNTQLNLRSLANFTLIIFVFCLITSGQVANVSQPLAPNQTNEREMNGAKTDRYTFDLKENEFFQVRVEQKGIDVRLSLKDSKNNELATMDTPNGKEGFETLTWVAKDSGQYILEVISPNEKAEKGIAGGK